MKWLIFLSFIFFQFCAVHAQPFQRFSNGSIPLKQTGSTASIAGYVIANYATDEERLVVVYNWVTSNIRYSKDSMYSINWATDLSTKASATLRRRKGVCENYASIFTDIIIKCGIPSYVVSGYTNVAGYGKNTGHTWTAVFLNNQWLLCDPTWDVGSGNRTNYLLITPEVFIESHIPFDPLWKLIPQQISDKKLINDSSFSTDVNARVQAFLQMDSIQQLEASSQRMRADMQQTEQQKNWQSYVKMQIDIVHGEEDMNLYNAAVEDLNKANAIFNNFIQYRNNQFIPYKPAEEINALLEPIYGILLFAKTKLDKIGKLGANEQYNTELIEQRVVSLTKKVKEQKVFLKNYLSGTVADRRKLFYQ